MNIGNLYTVKKWFWLLFPTKEPAMATSSPWPWPLPPFTAPEAADAADAAVATTAAAWYSKRFNCEVTYFPLDSIVVFLEEDGELKRVLTADGKIGWIWFTENYNDCFEEVKTES